MESKQLYRIYYNLYFNDTLVGDVQSELHYGFVGKRDVETMVTTSFKRFFKERFIYYIFSRKGYFKYKPLRKIVIVRGKKFKITDIQVKITRSNKVIENVTENFTFYRLSKELPFEEFRDFCIDNNLSMEKLKI